MLPNPAPASGYSRYVGRVGALAVALGIGAAIASMPGVAFADATGSPGSDGSSAGAGSEAPSAGSETVGSSPDSDGDASADVGGTAAPDADEGVVADEADDVADDAVVAVDEDVDADEVLDAQQGTAGASGTDAVEGPDADEGSAGSSGRTGSSGFSSVNEGDSAPVVQPRVEQDVGSALVAELVSVKDDEPASVRESASSSRVLVSKSPDESADAPVIETATPVTKSTNPLSRLTSLLSSWLGLDRQSADGPVAPTVAPLMWGAAAVARREVGTSTAPSANAAASPFRLFGNGTAENPNAGLLFGDGFSWDATTCTGTTACDGGNAGLWGGRAGNGWNGGNGGSAGLFGSGGNGGAGVPGGNGGEGGAGGLFGSGGRGGNGGAALTPGGAGGKPGSGGKGGLFGTNGQPGNDVVVVAPINQPPTITGYTTTTPDPSTGMVPGKVTASDPEGEPLTYSGSTSTGKGAVTVYGSGTGEFLYTPTAAARHVASADNAPVGSTTDTFTISVSDGSGNTTSHTITVAVSPANNAPTGGAVTGLSTDANGKVTGSITGVIDPDGDVLSYSAPASSIGGGAVTVSATIGTFTYTPTAREGAAADKTDAFSVAVSDGYGATATVTVIVPVAAVTPPAPSQHMAVGMNLENVVDWSPAWTFTDAFEASRPWISHSFNPQTWQTTWDPAMAPPLDLDADGNLRSLKTWTENGVRMEQYAGTLMFDALGGDYAGGQYHAEWDGTGVVTFGLDAVVTATGRTAGGRNFAELQVTPSDGGIYLRIEETSPVDPVRDFNVWMPDYNGISFRGQQWQPGAAFSPFHPLFLSRLAPFGTLRFMGMQETNTTDIVTWAQRRDAEDIRQGSGPGGTPSEPVVNGISVEYMVQLANELDADPWFNMPYAADDTFVRNFATYVREHLEPGRTVYVEWANEVWNFGYGFEASQWVAEQAASAGFDPDYGLWIVAGREAKRDMTIWSDVFATTSALHLVRVAAGWAAVDWVTNEIAENMDGAFDAIAIAPYITPTDEQRAAYTAGASVDRVIADTRSNIATSVQWVANHEQLAQDWSTRLGRPIDLLAYEGGAHLDGRGGVYQGAFYAASNDPRMGEVYRDYLKALDAAGMDLYVDFQFTGQAGAAPWGDFAKLHRMDEPLTGAYRYNSVVSAADGSLWSVL